MIHISNNEQKFYFTFTIGNSEVGKRVFDYHFLLYMFTLNYFFQGYIVIIIRQIKTTTNEILKLVVLQLWR